jgi:threonine synthase
MWRYRHAFGLPENSPLICLGEGLTPLVWGDIDGHPVAFKLEFTNPSGSFKDRGSALLVSFLISRGVGQAVEDSSGNAGASFAAYAARGGLKCRIFIPESASGPKRAQIEAYGAELVAVPGPRSQAFQAVQEVVEKGVVYASHAYLPFGLPGYASAAYEIVEQLSSAPGTVIVPVGHGNFLLGLAYGFMALKQSGIIDQIPRLVGVQVRACAPLWSVFTYGSEGLARVPEEETLAEGIRVRNPARSGTVIQAVQHTSGLFILVDEGDILPARDELARKGIYVEPTSAVILPAFRQIIGSTPGPIVSLLTGSGLKYRENY